MGHVEALGGMVIGQNYFTMNRLHRYGAEEMALQKAGTAAREELVAMSGMVGGPQ